MTTRILCAVFAVALAANPAVGQVHAPQEPPKQSLTAADANSHFEIMGPLGEPLGKFTEITAHVMSRPDKGQPELLAVTNVSGSRLSPTVVMPYRTNLPWANQVPLYEGFDYTLGVYQSGRFVGIPDLATVANALLQAEGRHFGTSLVVVKCLSSHNAALRFAVTPRIIRSAEDDEVNLLGESPR